MWWLPSRSAPTKTHEPTPSSRTSRVARYVPLPVVSAGIIGAAALELAGSANAATYDPQPQPGIVATPQTKAQPAMTATPGRWWHRHHPSLLDPTTAANFIPPGA